MSNESQIHLEGLRRMVAAHYPGVNVVQSASALKIGEDRYEVAPGVSLYVQAPVCPSGEPRKGLRRWRYSRAKRPPSWVYTRFVSSVYQAIRDLAQRNGHRELPRSQVGVRRGDGPSDP